MEARAFCTVNAERKVQYVRRQLGIIFLQRPERGETEGAVTSYNNARRGTNGKWVLWFDVLWAAQLLEHFHIRHWKHALSSSANPMPPVLIALVCNNDDVAFSELKLSLFLRIEIKRCPYSRFTLHKRRRHSSVSQVHKPCTLVSTRVHTQREVKFFINTLQLWDYRGLHMHNLQSWLRVWAKHGTGSPANLTSDAIRQNREKNFFCKTLQPLSRVGSILICGLRLTEKHASFNVHTCVYIDHIHCR